MFYAIEGTNTVLMGTMHRVPVGQDKWHDDARRAFEWAEHVVFEMHFEKAKAMCGIKTDHGPVPADFASLIASRWPDAVLGPLQDCNVPSAWLIGIGLGMDTRSGVEEMIREWAGGPEQIEELETPEEYVNAFADVPPTDFTASIQRRFKESAVAKQRFEQMYRAWRGHNVPKMTKLTNTLPPSIRQAMFDRRNACWAPKIAEFAKSSMRTLICVGAGHLHGEHGLLGILQRDHGLSSRRTTMTAP